MSFSWVPFYREVAERVLEHEDRQDELLALLRAMGRMRFEPTPKIGSQPVDVLASLTNVDPFSFLAVFSGVDVEKSKQQCAWLKQEWNLQTATVTDFDGRVTAEAHSPMFCKSNDNYALWQLAREAFAGRRDDVDSALFEKCAKMNDLSTQKLTAGLSWINPSNFLSTLEPMISYMESPELALGLEFNRERVNSGSFAEYNQFVEEALKINSNFPALCLEARKWKLGEQESQPAEKPMKKLSTPAQKKVVSSPSPAPLNQILYGPPGTGKTYSTVKHAVKIIDGKCSEDPKLAKARFEKLRKSGQIEFVTFHQSFSYEEFIEGLRPVLDEDGDGQARYEVRDGVLKTLALRATESAYQSMKSTRPSFDQVWNIFLEELRVKDVIEGLGKGRYKIEVGVTHVVGDNITGRAASEYKVNIEVLREIWEKLPFNSRPDSATLRGILGRGFACNLAGAIFQSFQAIETNMSAKKMLDFSNAPRYVLIVDEINRGNVSKILGELITLLEPDKRIGADNELRVQLPVSGDHFALPPNLYLLGTMNTADKSLALLDIALRRRFDFIEMAPDSSLFPSFAADVLTQLNWRLEVALDREHRIGHAYFMKCDDEDEFNAVFRAKIVPLLQEFFYNDWETLRAVLGEGGDKDGAFIKKLAAPAGMKARTKWRWWFDEDGAAGFDYLDVLRENYGSV